MLPNVTNYAVWPSVVPADKPSEMTIAPTEKAFLLFDDKEYTLTIIDVNGDEEAYHTPSSHQHLTLKAEGGVLRFTYTFNDEQEHLLILKNEDKVLGEMFIYSLREDLYSRLAFRGDFHGHSYRSDGKRDPAALMGHYREQGYDFLTLTDHNRFYPGGEIDETYAGVKLGITRVRGEEVHTPGSDVHIVHAGGNSSVAQIYIDDTEKYQAELVDYESRVPENIPEQYKKRYAKVMWATDRIHEAGGIAIFAHPFWRPGPSRMYNVQERLAKVFLKSGMFDAYELIASMGQGGSNLSVAMWADLRAEGESINVVGSSDVHALNRVSTFPNHFTICFAEENENDSLVNAVKDGMSVAVEAIGTEYERRFYAYGSFRLVAYAQFLLTHYFPKLQRICQGEGIAMRSYASGEATDKRLIELQVEQSESFRDRFFGRAPAILPTKEILDFENKWRETHITVGPTTKGSHITAEKITRQI